MPDSWIPQARFALSQRPRWSRGLGRVQQAADNDTQGGPLDCIGRAGSSGRSRAKRNDGVGALLAAAVGLLGPSVAEIAATITDLTGAGIAIRSLGERVLLSGIATPCRAVEWETGRLIGRYIGGVPDFADVYREKYLLLTTFTKDGRAKPTAVWGAPDGDQLLVITDDGSWKTKRIRNTPRVTIQKCGVLGAPQGEPVEAVARVLPKSETRRVYDAVVKRYWWHAWWFVPHTIVRGGIDRVHIGLEITPTLSAG